MNARDRRLTLYPDQPTYDALVRRYAAYVKRCDEDGLPAIQLPAFATFVLAQALQERDKG